jgi:hypothetical protein
MGPRLLRGREAHGAEGKWGQRDESKMERTAASFSFR